MDKLGTGEVIREEVATKDMMFKVVLIGAASVGKSCILLRAGKDVFKEEYEVTVGMDMCSMVVKMMKKFVELQIWDTAGMEQFRSMIKVFFHGAHAVLLVYDVTRKESFDVLDMWLQMIRESAPPETKVVLVGNKKDEGDNRQVAFESGQEYAKQHELFEFVETSAKTGEGVTSLFLKLAQVLLLEHEHITDSAPTKLQPAAKSKDKEKKGCC